MAYVAAFRYKSSRFVDTTRRRRSREDQLMVERFLSEETLGEESVAIPHVLIRPPLR
jgi:hypothetical protein